jgi:hypothetical protein
LAAKSSKSRGWKLDVKVMTTIRWRWRCWICKAYTVDALRSSRR